MTINIANVASAYDSLSAGLREVWDDGVSEMVEFYDEDTTCKETVDEFIAKANAYLAAQHSSASAPVSYEEDEEDEDEEPKPKKRSSTPKTTTKKSSSKKSTEKKSDAKEVELPKAEVRLIARYCKLNSKPFTQETKVSARNLLAALQKSIVDRDIRKTSPYKAEIEAMQSDLIELVKKPANGSLTFTIDKIDRYKQIAKSEVSMKATAAMRSFLRMEGKTPDVDTAKNLLSKVEKIVESKAGGKYQDVCKQIKDSLEVYVNDPSCEVVALPQTLNGIDSCLGKSLKKKAR